MTFTLDQREAIGEADEQDKISRVVSREIHFERYVNDEV